jgi:hypothetical protein
VILHLVTFTWKPSVTEEDVKGLTASLLAMARAIPEVRSYVCGPNLRLRPGADYAVAAVVDDEAGLAAYLDSEAHQQTYTDWFSWMIESREAAQLPVESALLTSPAVPEDG